MREARGWLRAKRERSLSHLSYPMGVRMQFYTIFGVVITAAIAATSIAASSAQPLCKRFSTFAVTRLNEPVSPCKLYFYADRFAHNERESYFRVIVQRDKAITLEDGEPRSEGGLQPYSYRWVILDAGGHVERSWLAHFLRNGDGQFHTVVKLSDDEWQRSRLDLYFEDVNGDGAREDVTYELPLRLALRPVPQE